VNWQEWKRRARQLSSQTYTFYLAYRQPRTSWYAKVFAALLVPSVPRSLSLWLQPDATNSHDPIAKTAATPFTATPLIDNSSH
jgi:hypothetical protein